MGTSSAARQLVRWAPLAAVLILLLPTFSAAQEPVKGAYVGVSVGVYLETGESRGRAAGISISGIAGYQFNDRWAIQGEFGRNGEVCNRATVNNKPKNVCHRDPLFSLDAVRRYESGSVRPYVAFGIGMGVHVGAGVEVPFGGHFAVVPAVDLNVLPDMLSARPKIAQFVRF